MHRTFNMGTGFVASLPEPDAETVVDELDDARIIGHVESGDSVSIHGLEL
jgi:phosphoribosylformylglycinamidine cyclo-ligase